MVERYVLKRKKSKDTEELEKYLKEAQLYLGLNVNDDSFIFNPKKATSVLLFQLKIGDGSLLNRLYISHAVFLAMESIISCLQINMMKIYDIIADRFNNDYSDKETTPAMVERGIRYSKEKFWISEISEKRSELGIKIFGDQKIPTNGAFIANIAEYLVLCLYDYEISNDK